jgi:hypothetical protein
MWYATNATEKNATNLQPALSKGQQLSYGVADVAE